MNIARLASSVEERGFESLWVAEHTHIPARGSEGSQLPRHYSHTLDPFVALTAAATATAKLRVGTAICQVVERERGGGALGWWLGGGLRRGNAVLAVLAVERGDDGGRDDIEGGAGEVGDVFDDASGLLGGYVGEQVGDVVYGGDAQFGAVGPVGVAVDELVQAVVDDGFREGRALWVSPSRSAVIPSGRVSRSAGSLPPGSTAARRFTMRWVCSRLQARSVAAMPAGSGS